LIISHLELVGVLSAKVVFILGQTDEGQEMVLRPAAGAPAVLRVVKKKSFAAWGC
jgi:hypothetical protein